MTDLQEEGKNAINSPMSPSLADLHPEDTLLGTVGLPTPCCALTPPPPAECRPSPTACARSWGGGTPGACGLLFRHRTGRLWEAGSEHEVA